LNQSFEIRLDQQVEEHKAQLDKKYQQKSDK